MLSLVLRLLWVAAVSICAGTGCIGGPACGPVHHPPLRVEGKVLDATGQPLVDTTVRLATARSVYATWRDQELLSALESEPPANTEAAWSNELRTTREGEFACEFPRRTDIIGGARIGFGPFGKTLGSGHFRDLLFLVKTEAEPERVYRVKVHRSRVEITPVGEPDIRLQKSKGEADRDKQEDMVRFTLYLGEKNTGG